MKSNYTTLMCDLDEEGVALVTLNRPEKLNAMDEVMLAEIDAVLTAYAYSGKARAMVLRGSEKAFTVGYDLKADDFDRDIGLWRADLNSISSTFRRLYDAPIPVLAAVTGYAVGGGLELMMCCDIAVAAADARLGESEVRHASGAPSMLMPWNVASRHVRYLLFSGDLISGEEAARINLVNRVVPAAEVFAETLRMARKLARVPPPAISYIKASINFQQSSAGFDASWKHNIELISSLHVTEEGRRWLKLLNEMPLRDFLALREAPFRAESSKA